MSHSRPSTASTASSTTRTGATTESSTTITVEDLHPGRKRYRYVMSKLQNSDDHARAVGVRSIKLIGGHEFGPIGKDNVVRVWHGSSKANIANIILNGFRLPSHASAFGAGIYFSKQSCKSLNYGDELLLCVVAAGRSMQVTSPDSSLNYETISANGYHSVEHQAGAHYNHHELVVYREDQVIPRCVVEYNPGKKSCH